MTYPAWSLVLGGSASACLVAIVALTVLTRNLDGETDREIDLPELGLKGHVGGSCPVLGEGTIGGASFEFYARNDSWSFDVSSTATAPWCIGFGDHTFQREGQSPGASYMDLDEAERIIRDCSRAFLGIFPPDPSQDDHSAQGPSRN